MSKESSRRDLSETALFGIGTLLVVEQSSLENQSRVSAKTPILTVMMQSLLLLLSLTNYDSFPMPPTYLVEPKLSFLPAL